MDWDGLVMRPGDQVTGWGRLVRNAQGTWFDPPVPVPLVMIIPPPVREPSSDAVPVTGADFSAVADHYELGRDVEGWATVTGVWTGSELRIERQSRRRPAVDPGPRWDTPPCPVPPGGWPHGMNGRDNDNLEVDLGDLEETGAAVTVVTFRPGADQAVMVVAAADPAAVEARLRPQLGQRLCVVPSRWTKRDLDRVHGHLLGRWADWTIYSLVVAIDEHAQAQVTANLARVLPDTATWAATLPPGILRLNPCLVPARATGDASAR
jgi:hypothetical protein